MSFLLHDPIWRPLGENGQTLPACYLTFYESGTTTPATVYADADLAAPLTNPVEADAAGTFPAIYGDSSIVYRRQLHDANDELIVDVDPMHPHAAFPPGTLMMFHGTAEDRDTAYPPALWELCDGDNDTPDTRDRGPVGVSGTKPISGDGSTGGTAGTVQTSSAGAHTHSVTVDGHTLTLSEVPAHHHELYCAISGQGDTQNFQGANGIAGDNTTFAYYEKNSGNTGTQLVKSVGGGGAHTHTGSAASNGDHTHTLAAQSPYFTVWFVKRKP